MDEALQIEVSAAVLVEQVIQEARRAKHLAVLFDKMGPNVRGNRQESLLHVLQSIANIAATLHNEVKGKVDASP